MRRPGSDELEPLLAELLAYYRALGVDYEDHTIWGLGGGEVADALDAFRLTGDVLELACGSGYVDSTVATPCDQCDRSGRGSGDVGSRRGPIRGRQGALH